MSDSLTEYQAAQALTRGELNDLVKMVGNFADVAFARMIMTEGKWTDGGGM